jgi:hypothetical protein
MGGEVVEVCRRRPLHDGGREPAPRGAIDRRARGGDELHAHVVRAGVPVGLHPLGDRVDVASSHAPPPLVKRIVGTLCPPLSRFRPDNTRRE